MAAIAAIFWSKTIQHFFIYNLLWYFIPSLESTGHSGQEKYERDFQDGGDGLLTEKTLAFFLIYKSSLFFYQVSGQLAFQFRRSSK